MRLLWSLPKAAPALLRHILGYVELAVQDLDQLQRDFGASRGSVSLVFSLAGFLYFGLGIVSGPLADRAHLNGRLHANHCLRSFACRPTGPAPARRY